jgi:hypothetical protein
LTKRFKGDFQLLVWMATLVVPVALAITTPYHLFVGGVLPYRWILLLTYPLSFFVVEAVLRIKWKRYKITIGIMLAILSMAFMVLPNAQPFSYFSVYTDYTPKSMLQNTVQLSDCQDTVNALKWARVNLPVDASLMVHEAFYGYALLNYGNNGLKPYVFDDLTNATQRKLKKGRRSLCT